MDKFFVYIYVDHDTGEPVYVGKGKGYRDVRHISIAKKGEVKGRLYNWMRRYYSVNNKWPIPFKIAVGMDEQTAYDLEKGLIALHGRKSLNNGSLYNLADGGGMGTQGFKRGKLLPESIAKRTASVLGRKNTPETIERMRKAQKGKIMSPDARAKISKAVRSRGLISEETRKKLSAAAKGKPSWCKGMKLSEETRKKMSISHKIQRAREACIKEYGAH